MLLSLFVSDLFIVLLTSTGECKHFLLLQATASCCCCTFCWPSLGRCHGNSKRPRRRPNLKSEIKGAVGVKNRPKHQWSQYCMDYQPSVADSFLSHHHFPGRNEQPEEKQSRRRDHPARAFARLPKVRGETHKQINKIFSNSPHSSVD